MIIDRTPLCMNEVEKLLIEIPENERKDEIKVFLKKFLKTKESHAIKIKKELEKSDILKIKREHIVKIIDLLPEDASDLNKIFMDVSLNEDETNKILEIIKKSK